MGRKERLRRVKQSKVINKVTKSEKDRANTSAKIMQMRADQSAHDSKLRETLVKMAQELARLKTENAVLNSALRAQGIIDDDKMNKAHAELQNQTRAMFNDKGQMRGNPVVTCYNTDFEIKTEGHEVKVVNTMSPKGVV